MTVRVCVGSMCVLFFYGGEEEEEKEEEEDWAIVCVCVIFLWHSGIRA